jgi:hypothetical protein
MTSISLAFYVQKKPKAVVVLGVKQLLASGLFK